MSLTQERLEMNEKKRINLGFEDGSDDEEVEITRSTSFHRKSKLPKLSFKTHDINQKSVIPSKEKSSSEGDDRYEDSNDSRAGDVDDDYMKFTVQEDETTGPQRLRASDDTRNKKSNTEDKECLSTTESKATLSLFGMITENDSNSMMQADVIRPLPSAQLKNSSKGLSIMEKMGFKIGDTLGKNKMNKEALLEPLPVEQRRDRQGIKEKEKEEEEKEKRDEKGITNDQIKEFRYNLVDEKNIERKEKLLHKMQKLCWQLTGGADIPDVETVDPRGVNVLWRSYVKFIQNLKREKREQSALQEDDTARKDRTKQDGENGNIEDDELRAIESENENDDELLMWEEMSLKEQVEKIYLFLRTEYDYCFYCGTRYMDQKDLFEHCPGLREDDHE